MKKTIFLFMVVIFMFTQTATPFVVLNDIVPVFPMGERDKIESFVIEGAVHFLQAKSYADLLLREYEKSGKEALNFPTALEYAEKAISELEKAKNDYMESITEGTRAGYVPEIIARFKDFDYNGIESDKNLNMDLMASVKSYLSRGDILGAYEKNVNNIEKIIATLHSLKEKLEVNAIPDISLFWQLLQQFSTAALFGNYCTQTAAAIL